MKELKEKILTEGVAIGTQIVKVDNFLNHKLDVAFLDRVGKEFHRRFADCEINKILTVEASGIAVACMAAGHFGYPPVVYAKKAVPSTMYAFGKHPSTSRTRWLRLKRPIILYW